ncbi:MAG: N-6 DNA methylase, partial [Zoogloeaceae bacterium]|nr:N-6 DNA methylase [Zoogloeaceae bacterium]
MEYNPRFHCRQQAEHTMTTLKWDEIQANALAFSARWKDGWDEKSEAQSFVRDFLAVFGVRDAAAVGRFEERAQREEGRGFMDYFWKKEIAIEMKTKNKDLKLAYEQLKDYVIHLPGEEMPDLLMVSDFENIILYRRTTAKKIPFKTKNLYKYIRHFANIAGYETTRLFDDQMAVNVEAAEKMAKLHDALKEYGYEGHELEVYLVRLLFCLFADDTGIFPGDSFTNYIENSKMDGSDLSARMVALFEVLNMTETVRAKKKLLSADLKNFRYINGGLFSDRLPPADFNDKMRGILLDCCHFDWNKISPAIFGAMFQGVMDKTKRRELGAHYTSEENILKLVNPLFMDELWQEFEKVKHNPKQLDFFHDKISRLKFLDPACGCGNFLIVTYRELRKLELELLKMKRGSKQLVMDVSPLLKVNVEQFYGIECEDFPCQVAQVGMWLVDHQMNLAASEQFGMYYARLPLTQSATIVHGNALRIKWEDTVPKEELSNILGNPPFVGKKEQSRQQKTELLDVFQNQSGAGNLDYVTAWYKSATEYISNTNIRVAFVSTNSISQGEHPAILWKSLLASVKIDFAYRTFKWSNEAKGKAAVHCVIIGFSAK